MTDKKINFVLLQNSAKHPILQFFKISLNFTLKYFRQKCTLILKAT